MVWVVEATGRQVVDGDLLVVLESMKMEIPIGAPVGGVAMEIRLSLEQSLEEGDMVATIERHD